MDFWSNHQVSAPERIKGRNKKLIKKHSTLLRRLGKTIYTEGKQGFEVCLQGEAEFRKEMGKFFKAENLGLGRS